MLVKSVSLHTNADEDRDKLALSDDKFAKYLCAILDVYFDYHREAYFLKGMHMARV